MDIKEVEWLERDTGEKITWKGKPHFNSLYPSIAIGILLTPLMGLGLFIIAYAYLHRENTEYLITGEAIYRKTGIIGRNVKKIDFGKIQDTSYSQGYFGRIFEYGNVEISTAGGSAVEMRFRSVPEPRKVQDIISKRIGDRDDEEYSKSREELLSDILEELREINEKLD